MVDIITPLYSPALRMKKGELDGLRSLAPDIADRVLPRMIVPPRGDRDKELELALGDASVPNVGALLSRSWRGRAAFIDPTFLFDDFGIDGVGNWLPKMFEMARREQVLSIPLATLDDLLAEHFYAFKDSLNTEGPTKLALRVLSGDLVGSDLFEKIDRALSQIGLAPEQCAVIVDFCDADFSNYEFVADIIQGALETFQEAGMWQQIIFQGTHFPEANPAKPDSVELVPRNEWKAWRQAVKFDNDTAEHMIFGDYAADSAKMVFGGGAARAIRHYRYTTSEHWLIQRGALSGKDATVMRSVCNEIINSGHFAGREFSVADEYIHAYGTGQHGVGPGNSTHWRATNTTHHITRVVSDVGKVRGIDFAKKTVGKLQLQDQLF